MIEDVKNLLIETLDSKGILGQIRAQLRSSVFKAIDEQDNKYGFGFKWENPTLYKIIGSKLGILSAELIREFMESHRMDYSLSTFIPESSISPEKIKKEDILIRLGLKPEDYFNDVPLLQIMTIYFMHSLNNNLDHVINFISSIKNQNVEHYGEELINHNINIFNQMDKNSVSNLLIIGTV